MIARAPDLPFYPERSRGCVRGRVIVKLAAEHARYDIPHYLEVRRGQVPAGAALDQGPADRVLRAHSPAMQVTRAFRPARRVSIGTRRAHWDDLEVATGMSRTFRIDVDPDVGILPLVRDLSDLAGVESVSPQYLCQTPFSAPATTRPHDRVYAQRMVGVEAALAFEPGDSALVVGLVDSGVDLDHAELRGSLRHGIDTVDLPPARVSLGMQLIGDTEEQDRIPRDEMGHGTACASILRAAGLNVPRGLAGAAWVLPMRALAAARLPERGTLTAVGAVTDIDDALKLAVDLGARVLNLSFGTPENALREDDPRPHADVIEYALRRGCILVAAAGNQPGRACYYPAAQSGVIAVGSVGESGSPSSFSTRGDHVALCAPGEHVLAAGIGGYTTNTGTSFAAPFVAGACALLLARASRYGVPLDVETARAVLTATARPFPDADRAEGCGAGILDVPAALRVLEQVLAEPRAPLSSSPLPSAEQPRPTPPS